MARMSLRSRLLLALAYVLLLAVVALLVPLVGSVRDRVNAEVKTQALADAEVVAALAVGAPAGRLGALARRAAASARGRVVIVDRGGRVLADSAGTPTGAGYRNRPEIAGALAGRVVQIERASATLHQRLLATAVPVPRAGAVRVTQSVASVRRAVRAATLGLVLVGALVLLLGLTAGALIAGQIARPLHRLAAAARRIHGGDLNVRVVEEGSREQRELARAFNDMTGRVEALVRGQREFIADASHQLRTPLTGLRLRLEEANAGTNGTVAREQLAGALHEVDRLAGMVGDLLALSEAEQPGAQPGEAVDLGTAARAAAERWAAAAAERGARVLAAGEGTAECSRADLDGILDVLLENSLAYGPPGQTVRIEVAPGRIELLDEGPGLPTGEAEAVFARFHRGRAGRGGPAGTGLGLAIARELAHRRGGEVTLANRRGGGAAARVTLRRWRS
jgi:signal transduction histidine kinase